MIILGTDRTRDIKRDMLDYLPKYYEEVRESANIVNVESTELESLNADIKDVLDQLFVDTATWGLAKWEKVVGIITDNTKTYEQRRSAIKSKLRGMGTVTLAMIKNVGDSFYSVDVKEDYANYQITIVSVGERGVPDNFADLEKAINEIIPAHLKTVFEFTYLTWDELDAALLTWDKIGTYTWDQLETSFF